MAWTFTYLDKLKNELGQCTLWIYPKWSKFSNGLETIYIFKSKFTIIKYKHLSDKGNIIIININQVRLIPHTTSIALYVFWYGYICNWPSFTSMTVVKEALPYGAFRYSRIYILSMIDEYIYDPVKLNRCTHTQTRLVPNVCLMPVLFPLVSSCSNKYPCVGQRSGGGMNAPGGSTRRQQPWLTPTCLRHVAAYRGRGLTLRTSSVAETTESGAAVSSALTARNTLVRKMSAGCFALSRNVLAIRNSGMMVVSTKEFYSVFNSGNRHASCAAFRNVFANNTCVCVDLLTV